MKNAGRTTPAEEKSGFEWFVDLVMARRKEFPTMHVYHFGGYEPGAFKNLMGLYATREEEIDSMLRAGLFVDLHAVFKQALRAGVEEYSLKTLEHFAGFKRSIHKDDSRAAMRYITHSLELGWAEEIPDKFHHRHGELQSRRLLRHLAPSATGSNPNAPPKSPPATKSTARRSATARQPKNSTPANNASKP